MKFKAVVVAFFALALTGSAMADVIEFSTSDGHTSGTIQWLGGIAPLIGSGIKIAEVAGAGTPSNSGVQLPVTSGLLGFTTGAFDHYDTGAQTFYWKTGGGLTITGSGPGCLTLSGCGTGTPNTTSGSPLLSGSLISARLLGGQLKLFVPNGTDTKDPTLLNFYGEAPGMIWVFSGGISTTPLPTTINLTTGFTVQSAGGTHILNTVPDGGMTLMLLGSALVGLETLRRRSRV